jgi:pimeloyl-ACP methyl ester carboxylesterase
MVRAQDAAAQRARAAFDTAVALETKYENAHGRYVTANGMRMHYLEWGASHGMPLVWAHGSASTAFELRALAPRLVEMGYRVIAPSYRGHGKTQIANYDVSIYHIADDLVALLDSLKIPRAVIGGASKGGFVAAAVWDEYPERVAGLILHDGGSWSNQWIFDRYPAEVTARQVRGGGPPRIVRATRFEVFQALAAGLLNAPNPPDPERLLDLVSRINRTPDGSWSFIPGFEQLMGMPELFLAATTRPTTLPLLQWSQHALIPTVVFRDLSVPTLIIDPQSNDDDLPVTEQNEKLKALHPDLIVHRIYPQTSHAAFRDRPDWFLRDARELLLRVRQSARR